MTSSPEFPRNRRADDDRRDLGALTRLARDLAGTLRPPSIIDTLMETLARHFSARICGLSLYDVDSDRLEVRHGDPERDPYLVPLLDTGMRRGPLVLAPEEAERLPAGAPRAWIAAPIISKSVIIGALALGRDAPPFTDDDVALVEAFVAQASLALESARLVDQVESGKRTWAEAVDALHVPLCIIDQAGRVRRSNLEFARLVNVPAEGVTGRPWLALVPPAWRDGVSAALEQNGAGIDLPATDGAWRVSARRSGTGGLTVLHFEDRHRQRQLQEQLLQSQKLAAVGQLVAGIAHDLNNPLASVLGFADFLAESPEVPPALREPLRVIQEEAVHASTIVRNLLGFARKGDGTRRHVDVERMVEGTRGLLRNHLLAHHVELEISVEEGLPPVLVQANRIQQVLINLLGNAAHAVSATGQSGMIHLEASLAGEQVAISVTDTGTGIPPEVQDRIFEPFFTTKPDGEGTGLGLTICRDIIHDHGGTIEVTSIPGRGTTFRILLPAGDPSEGPARASGPTSGPVDVPPLDILAVDDEPHILHYLRTTLEAWGHRVTVAADGEEALIQAMSGDFDLIISDLRMPRVGGREFFEALSEADPARAARVVFSTGDTVRGDTMDFLEQEGKPYLNKPFSLAELRAVLASAHNARTTSPDDPA